MVQRWNVDYGGMVGIMKVVDEVNEVIPWGCCGGGAYRMILAIDPGTAQSAFVLFDRDKNQILDKAILPNSDVLHLVESASDVDVAVEMIASYGMAVGKETFETCVWIGRFVQTAINKEFPCDLVYRKDVKMHLCGSTRAKDANIRQALIDLLGKEKTKGVAKDMWAALGVAVTVAGIQ